MGVDEGVVFTSTSDKIVYLLPCGKKEDLLNVKSLSFHVLREAFLHVALIIVVLKEKKLFEEGGRSWESDKFEDSVKTSINLLLEGCTRIVNHSEVGVSDPSIYKLPIQSKGFLT
jgi:hypothetical protein